MNRRIARWTGEAGHTPAVTVEGRQERIRNVRSGLSVRNVPEEAIAVVVEVVAPLLGGRRCVDPADELGVGRVADQQALGPASAEAGDTCLVHIRVVVDHVVTVIVDAIADLGAAREGIHRATLAFTGAFDDPLVPTRSTARETDRPPTLGVVDDPVAVVIESVALLVCARSGLRRTHERARFDITGVSPLSRAAADSDTTERTLGERAVVGPTVAVIVQTVADLGLRWPLVQTIAEASIDAQRDALLIGERPRRAPLQ